MERQQMLVTGFMTSAFLLSAQVQAAAFQLLEQNAVGLGTAYSGTAAIADDASSIFTNPAALSNINNKQVSLSSIAIAGHAKVNVESSVANFGATTQGSSGGSPTGTAVIPGLYFAQRIGTDWVVGIGTSVPFGLKTEYDASSLARYVATKSEVRTIDIMPTVAYAVNKDFSVGASLDIMEVRASLDGMLDMSNNGTPVGDTNGTNEAKSWAYTYHTGVHYHDESGKKIGLTYHAPVSVTAKGDSVSALTGQPDEVKASVNLPASVVMSVSTPLTTRLTMLGDAQYTRWDTFKRLQLEYGSGAVFQTEHFFKNTWRLATGLDYKYNERVHVKLGAAYDKSPVNPNYRTARIPDADRLWTSIGVSYVPMRNLHLHAGYSHLFFKSVNVDDHGLELANGTPLTAGLEYKANYKTSADIIGLQLSWDYV